MVITKIFRNLNKISLFFYSQIKSEQGFTFLEVMAALTIMVIALVPILENQALNIKSTQRAYATSQAANLAASLLATYRATGYPEQSKETGHFDLPLYENFSYEYQENGSSFPGIARDVLIIRWGKKSDELIEITNYVLDKNK